MGTNEPRSLILLLFSLPRLSAIFPVSGLPHLDFTTCRAQLLHLWQTVKEELFTYAGGVRVGCGWGGGVAGKGEGNHLT